MTNKLILVGALAALPASGCQEEGPNADPNMPAVDQDNTTSPTTDDGEGPAVPSDDDTEPPEDEPEPAEDDPFEVPNHEARLLPYDVRITNLATLLGVEPDHFLFDELHTRRTLLGDHDYANGVAPDLSWSPTKMGAWVKGLKPICSSALWLQHYPSLSTDPAPLLRHVLAREPDAAELAAYSELATSTASPARADELTCLAALSSLDFVAQ